MAVLKVQEVAVACEENSRRRKKKQAARHGAGEDSHPPGSGVFVQLKCKCPP